MKQHHKDPYLDVRKVLGFEADKVRDPLWLPLASKLTGIDRMNALMEEIGRPWPDAGPLIETLFERLDINWSVENPHVLEQLDDRPKIFVANHPYGLPDAFALFQLLTRYRSNIRVFANKLLAATQLEEPSLLFVDPFGADASRGQNRKSIAQALKHVRSGGDLALFPGRICSHLKTSDWTISDAQWTDQVRKFVEVSGGDMVPLYISGRNSIMFNAAGLIHPRLRTYMLLREFLRGGHNFIFRAGLPVSAEQLAQVSRSMPVGGFARSLVYAMKTRTGTAPDIPVMLARAETTSKPPHKNHKALIGDFDLLAQQGDFQVLQIKNEPDEALLDLIGEIRLKAYGDQPGITKPRQLVDRYDAFYRHMLLWDKKHERIAGVYRYTLPKSKQDGVGMGRLVTSGIFDISGDFESLLTKSMELGRAAILPEYQRNYVPLMLLWHGILEVARRDQNIRYLFGPVTMGRHYTSVSRELLRRFVMRKCVDEARVNLIKPHREPRFEIPREVQMDELANACSDFGQLGSIVEGFEGGQRRLPVLFRHYSEIGCKYLGFGEWHELDGALAGLTLLDLKNIRAKLLNRFFGKNGAMEFHRHRYAV